MRIASVSLFLLLALAFSAQAQRRAETSGLTADRVSKIVERVRAHPADSRIAEETIEVAFDLLRSRRYEEGLSLFTAVREANRRDNRVMYGSALALFNLGRTDEAEQLARRAIEVSGKEGNLIQQERYGAADALVLLGVVLAVKGDSAGALAAVRQAVAIAPANFDAQFALGRALYGAGDPQSAALAFQRAVALRPDDPQSRFFLATALEAAGEYEKARLAYADLVALEPGNAEGHLGLGVLLLKLDTGKTEDAIRELSKAVALDGNLYEARATLGRTLIKVGRPEQAVEHLMRAVQLSPDNPEPHYQLAIAYRRLGKKAEAEHESARVKEIHAQRHMPQSTPNQPY